MPLLAPEYLHWLLSGAAVTVALSLLVIAVALPLGFAACMARLSTRRVLRGGAGLLLSTLRNSPLLVQLFFWYFALPTLLPASWRLWLNTPHRWGPEAFGLAWPPLEYLAAFIGLALYSAAFFAEEFRAGVRAVPTAQWSAASALGLSRGQRWRHVILPQAWRLALPTLAGQAMNVVKNSSLAMTIGVAELSYMARQVESQSFQAFQAFALATALYLAIIVLIELGAAVLDRRVALAAQGH